MSYKDAMNSPEMKNFRKKMERKLSGIDLIEAKQFHKEVIEESDINYFESRQAKASFIATRIKKLDPREQVDHMFVDENALRLDDEPEVPVSKSKKTMWTHVFDAVQNWPKHKT